MMTEAGSRISVRFFQFARSLYCEVVPRRQRPISAAAVLDRAPYGRLVWRTIRIGEALDGYEDGLALRRVTEDNDIQTNQLHSLSG
jgi:hypothetical protein